MGGLGVASCHEATFFGIAASIPLPRYGGLDPSVSAHARQRPQMSLSPNTSRQSCSAAVSAVIGRMVAPRCRSSYEQVRPLRDRSRRARSGPKAGVDAAVVREKNIGIQGSSTIRR